MEQEAPQQEPTCGDCKFWRRVDMPQPRGIIDLSKLPPPTGICRYNPPTMVFYPPNQARAMYPLLTSDSITCSHFSEVGETDAV